MRMYHLMMIGLVASLGGCQSCTGGGATAKEDMQLVPKETEVVFMGNLSRMRNTAMWRKMLDLRDSDASTKKDYDDFVQKCQLDPLKQIDSVFVAFPQTGAADQGQREFAAILRGTFNEQKLVECATAQAKKDGQELATSEYNGHKLYTSTKQGQAFATFLDSKTVVLAGKEWVKKVIDLQTKKEAGGSAKDNAPLMELVKRAKTSDGIWGAGTVPQATRDQFKQDKNLASAGSMKDIFGSVDFQNGFAAELNVDLGSDADAQDLSTKVKAQLDDAKKNPQFMMLGLNSFLDNVKLETKGSTFRTLVSFNQQQVDDLINRVKGVLANFKNALGGGMGGGGMPPPSMPMPQQ
jgi:hypothetical protein